MTSRVTLLTARAGIEWSAPAADRRVARRTMRAASTARSATSIKPTDCSIRAAFRSPTARTPGQWLHTTVGTAPDRLCLADDGERLVPAARVRAGCAADRRREHRPDHPHPSSRAGCSATTSGSSAQFAIENSTGGLAVEHGRIAARDGTLVAESFQTRLTAALSRMYAHSRRTLTIASLATLATFLDTTVLYVAFPDITATFSDASAARAVVGAERLHDRVRGAADPGGQDRRPGRAPARSSSSVRRCSPPRRWRAGSRRPSTRLIAFRVLQAAGAAALIPSSLALVMHAFAHDQLPRAVAIWGAAGAAAGALGPTLGAALVEGFGWRSAFFLNLPVGIYTIVDGRRHLRESSAPDMRIPSFVGIALVAGAAASAVVRADRHRGRRLARRRPSSCSPPARRAGRVRRPPVAHRRAGARPRPVPVAELLVGQPRDARLRHRVLGDVLQFDPVPHPGVGLVDPQGRPRRRARARRSWRWSRRVWASWPGRIGQRPILIVGGLIYAAAGAVPARDARARGRTTSSTTSRR